MNECFIEFNPKKLLLIQNDILEKVDNNRNKWSTDKWHSVYKLPKHMVLTDLGKEIFKESQSLIDVFRVPPNFVTGIHKDKSVSAINFIVRGMGSMEWFNNSDLTFKHLSEYGTEVFNLSEHANPLTVSSSNGLIVNTRIPHRIVNKSDQERICISIRYNYFTDKMFDALSKQLV